jgi:hypothetical protein
MFRPGVEKCEPLAARNPETLDVQILVAQIPDDTSGAEEEAEQKSASLRRAYRLIAEVEARLAAVEADIPKRKGSDQPE